jgi:hypothetical protein
VARSSGERCSVAIAMAGLSSALRTEGISADDPEQVQTLEKDSGIPTAKVADHVTSRRAPRLIAGCHVPSSDAV